MNELPRAPHPDDTATEAAAIERLLVIHIMKTAGTSLRRMLDEELGPGGVYPNDADLRTLPRHWYPETQEVIDGFDELPPHRVLIGHFPASVKAALPVPYQSVTFVREPVERTVSMIEHRRRLAKLGPIPVEQLLEDTRFVESQLADYQTKVLGMGIGHVNHPWPTDDATLTAALANLDEMEFVGLTERFAESCEVFDRRFATQISGRIQSANSYRSTPAPEDIARMIEPLVQRDLELYRVAVERFERSRSSVSRGGGAGWRRLWGRRKR